MEFLRCYDEPECAPLIEVDNKLEDSYIYFLIQSYYFDFNDLDNPVKSFLITNKVYRGYKSYTQTLSFYVRENRYVLNDALMRIGENDPEKFYSIEQSDYEVQRGFYNVALYAYLFRDPIVDEYERNVLSFLDVTGTIGGVFEILVVFSGFVIGIVTNQLFDHNVANPKSQEQKGLFSYPVIPNKIPNKKKTTPSANQKPNANPGQVSY